MQTANLTSVVELLDALEGTGTAAWGWDIRTDVVRWSENTGPLYGRPRGYKPEGYEDWLSLIEPQDRPMAAEAVRRAVEDGEDYEFEIQVRWPDGTFHWLWARGHPVLDDDGRPVRIVGVVSDVTQAKRRTERERFLAEAGVLLTSTLDIDEMLGRSADLMVAGLADWCSIQLFDDGVLRNAVISHADPERRALAQRLNDDYPPPEDPVGPIAVILETGRGLLLEDIPDELLGEAAVDDEHLSLLRSLGLRSAAIVPIKARDEILGVLGLVSAESAYRFDAEDLAFAEEFARRAGLAIENARLFDEAVAARAEAEQVASRLALLQGVIAELARGTDLDAVVGAAIEHGVGSTGAARGALVLRTDAGLEMVATAGYGDDILAPFVLAQPGPLSEAVYQGVPVYLESIADLVDRFPDLAQAMSPDRDAALAIVPIQSTRAGVGALALVYDSGQQFPAEDRAFLEALGQHAGVAVERSRLYERMREVASTLQAALAPPADPSRAGLAAAAWYRPAGIGDVGGDWYDVIDSPRSTHFYIIGDVVGRGLDAVSAMAQLRHAVRLLVVEGRSPAEALLALSSLAVADDPAFSSTVLCVEVDPGTGLTRMASAGHLKPILTGTDGAEVVDMAIGPPLGVGSERPPDHEITLSVGHCLVLFTDGVVERRHRDIGTSLSLFRDRLAGQEPIVAAIAADLLEMVEETEDDATLLVIQRTD